MENEKLLPCKSCGKPLNSFAESCPNCGDPTPFCFDVKAIEQRGKEDAGKTNRVELATLAFFFVANALLFCFFHKVWWISLIASIVLIVSGPHITGKRYNNLHSQFLVDIDSDYKNFKKLYHYDLTDEQYKLWRSRANSVYIEMVMKNLNDILVDLFHWAIE